MSNITQNEIDLTRTYTITAPMHIIKEMVGLPTEHMKTIKRKQCMQKGWGECYGQGIYLIDTIPCNCKNITCEGAGGHKFSDESIWLCRSHWMNLMFEKHTVEVQFETEEEYRKYVKYVIGVKT